MQVMSEGFVNVSHQVFLLQMLLILICLFLYARGNSPALHIIQFRTSYYSITHCIILMHLYLDCLLNIHLHMLDSGRSTKLSKAESRYGSFFTEAISEKKKKLLDALSKVG